MSRVVVRAIYVLSRCRRDGVRRRSGRHFRPARRGVARRRARALQPRGPAIPGRGRSEPQPPRGCCSRPPTSALRKRRRVAHRPPDERLGRAAAAPGDTPLATASFPIASVSASTAAPLPRCCKAVHVGTRRTPAFAPRGYWWRTRPETRKARKGGAPRVASETPELDEPQH